MSLRLLGGLLVVGCGGLGGLALGRREQNRLDQCRLLCSYLEGFYAQLEYSLAPLEQVAAELAAQPAFSGLVFARLCGSCPPGVPFFRHFDAAARQQQGLFGPEVCRCLVSLGGQLGSAPLQSQLAALRHCRRGIGAILEGRQPKVAQNIRLYRSLGLLGGVAAVLLLW